MTAASSASCSAAWAAAVSRSRASSASTAAAFWAASLAAASSASCSAAFAAAASRSRASSASIAAALARRSSTAAQLGLVLGGLRGGDFPLAGELGLALAAATSARQLARARGALGFVAAAVRAAALALAASSASLGELGAGRAPVPSSVLASASFARALALVGELGLRLRRPSAQLLHLGVEAVSAAARACGQLGYELLLLGAWAGGGFAGRRELGPGGVQVGARLDQLGLRAHQLAAQLHELGAHVLGLGGVDGALDGRPC